MNPFEKFIGYLKSLKTLSQVNASLSRGAVTASCRILDEKRPSTWEFSAFSQNGEDGIIDFLLGRLKNPNRYFVELGASNALENNSSWLAIARRYQGVMIEGDPQLTKDCKRLIALFNCGVSVVNAFITKENTADWLGHSLFKDPDFFSIDIDGNDYYVADGVLAAGYRPKIFSVEYNSCFGPQRPLTIPYKEDFNMHSAHPTRLYYGVGIGCWKKFFAKHDYRFVTVDQNGVNAFFADPNAFVPGFLENLEGLPFQENFSQKLTFKVGWDGQMKLIEDMKFIEI